MKRIQEKTRNLFDIHSISFRLYLIIIPTTILAIMLISYVDNRVTTSMLDQDVKNKTTTIAGQLADDLARLDPATSPELLHIWLGQIVETNFYISRIDVFRLAGDTLTRIVTTSNSITQPISVDEMNSVRRAIPLEFTQFQDRERVWKEIVPFANRTRTVIGCVSVVSSLSESDLVAKVHDQINLYLIPSSIAVLVLLLHFLFTRVLTGRIWRLGHAMAQARQGDLAKRAPVDRHDELGAIAQLFNETMGEIERASRERDQLLEEQKNFNAQLQAKVREATQELSSANIQLGQVNQDLLETQRRLTRYERMAIAGQMAAAFAHEVGSPLSAISTHLELMAEESSCSGEARHRIQLVQQQIGRITGFVEELLSETRAAVKAHGRVQLNSILRQLLLFLGQHFERHQILIETQLEPSLPEIEADAQQLQQVFLNLLNNAADALPHGGTVRVETRVETDERGRELAAVSVSDNGVGIAPEEQQRIFEPFFSTKDFRRGTGLGLSIAARIVRQHGGTISLESTPGVGTTFTIRFPSLTANEIIPEEVSTT
ncbi:MAG: HAMP domain-containing protein [Acidobacteriia bacterium]|nr:HAMP domain-containing protein [Terriglobia bacterium]